MKHISYKKGFEKFMVLIYALDLQQLPDPKEHPEFLTRIPQMRREKTMRYKFADARKQSFGAGLLLQEVMKRHNIKEEDIYIGKNGKPETKNICFNLSHSKELAICVVSVSDVGCDIEKIRKAPKKIAQKSFCPSEVLYLESFSEEQYDEQFFRLWTMKESYLKMTGEGIGFGFNRIAFHLEGDTIQVRRDGMLQSCFIKEYQIPEYKVTICAKEEQFAQKVFFIDNHIYN